MLKKIAELLGFGQPQGRRLPPDPKILFTRDCFEAVKAGLAPKIQQGHEGIIYLLGRTDGLVTLAAGVFRPFTRTTAGSFDVPLVGQIHTHPGEAYHSDGDVEGARIRHRGYVSLVIPDYGRHLPNLAGSAAYIWQDERWVELSVADIIIIPGAGPWIAKNGSISETAGR
jgi:hypothetical protein